MKIFRIITGNTIYCNKINSSLVAIIWILLINQIVNTKDIYFIISNVLILMILLILSSECLKQNIIFIQNYGKKKINKIIAIVRKRLENTDSNTIKLLPQTAKKKSGKRPPLCHKCKDPMIVKVTKARKYYGVKFWGCSNFPDCRCILDLRTLEEL